MSSRSVVYNLTLQCIENNLAPSQYEWGLQAQVYLTGHFERNAVEVDLKQGKPVQVQIKGELPAAARGKIPATAAVCFAGTVLHQNANGVGVKVDAGTSHILLTELEKISSKDVRLVMRTVGDNYSKATIRVTSTQKQIGASLKFAPLPINASAAMNEMSTYVEHLYNTEMNIPNTIPGTDNIRCFLNMSEEGSQITGQAVPAIGYVEGEIPKSNRLFWHNALKNVLRRENQTIDSFLKMDSNQQADIAFLLIDYPVTILPYISDEIDRRKRRQRISNIAAIVSDAGEGRKVGIENFGEVLALLGGDCEDLAKGIIKVSRALDEYAKQIRENKPKEPNKVILNVPDKFKNIPADPEKTILTVSNLYSNQSPDLYDKAIIRINDILDQYVPLMTLCVVHGAKADDDSSMPKGAHMSDIGLPAWYFKDCLERTKEGQEISSRLPWPKNLDRTLETKIGEGTGMLTPGGYRDPKAHVRAYLHQGPYLAALKHPMVQEHGVESPFFLGALQGWTPYFSDRGNSDIGAFWYVDAKKETRGTLYTDFTNERKNVALRPMPVVPDSVQFLMQEANMFCIPPTPLVLSEQKGEIRNKALDHLQKSVDALKRKEGSSSVDVTLFASPHQITEQLTKGMFEDVNKLSKIWKVRYVGEPVTDKYHGFAITFSINA